MIPALSRVRVLRGWGGIVDMSMDGSPIIDRTHMGNLYLNSSWSYGGFKATPASGYCFAHLLASGEPHKTTSQMRLDRFERQYAIDERGMGAQSNLHQSFPWLVLFSVLTAARAPRNSSPSKARHCLVHHPMRRRPRDLTMSSCVIIRAAATIAAAIPAVSAIRLPQRLGQMIIGMSAAALSTTVLLTAGAERTGDHRQWDRTESNSRATMQELYAGLEARSQNCWPSLDIGSVNALFSPFLGAGFYYKTFMWPAAFWERLYER
jgi:hypothetical protein